MQQPLVIFDHNAKTVTTIQTGPHPDKRVGELVAAQQQQVATSGRPK
jgi:hypothetical protein